MKKRKKKLAKFHVANERCVKKMYVFGETFAFDISLRRRENSLRKGFELMLIVFFSHALRKHEIFVGLLYIFDAGVYLVIVCM